MLPPITKKVIKPSVSFATLTGYQEACDSGEIAKAIRIAGSIFKAETDWILKRLTERGWRLMPQWNAQYQAQDHLRRFNSEQSKVLEHYLTRVFSMKPAIGIAETGVYYLGQLVRQLRIAAVKSHASDNLDEQLNIWDRTEILASEFLWAAIRKISLVLMSTSAVEYDRFMHGAFRLYETLCEEKLSWE